MQSIYDIRRDNLRTLIGRRFGGSQTALAKAIDLAQPSFVSRLLTGTESAKKNIGSRLARRIEVALGLAPNWFDTPDATLASNADVHDVPRESRSYDDDVPLNYVADEEPGDSPFTPAMARALVTAKAEPDQRVLLLSAAEAGQLDAIAAAYPKDDLAARVTAHTDVAPPHAIALRLPDNSMGERFPEGSIVVIVDTKSPQAGDFVVGVLPGTRVAAMREWAVAANRRFLVPNNASYKATEAGPDFRLLGVVVEAIVQL